VDGLGVLHDAQHLGSGATGHGETELLDGRIGVVEQALPEGAVDPGAGDDLRPIGRGGGGQDPVEEGVEVLAADHGPILEEHFQVPHTGGHLAVGVPVRRHVASSSAGVR
jgi:hypothetical protein